MAGASKVAGQFPALIAELKAELKAELLEEMGAGEWVDQDHTVLGRNKHIKACKRLMRAGTADAHFDRKDKRWLIRRTAYDREIAKSNRALAKTGVLDSVPPPALAPLMPPVKAEPASPDVEDETGVYYLELLSKVRRPS